MKTKWLALNVIIILAVCIGLGYAASSGTSSSKATADVTVKPASGKSAGAINTPQSVPVTLTVAAAPPDPAVISLNPASFSFSGAQGGANPSNQTLTASSSGDGILIWSLSKTAVWLTLSKGSSINEGSTLSVDISGLNPGTYVDNITFTASGAINSPFKVPVVLTISAAISPPLNPVILNSIGGSRHCRCGTDHAK